MNMHLDLKSHFNTNERTHEHTEKLVTAVYQVTAVDAHARIKEFKGDGMTKSLTRVATWVLDVPSDHRAIVGAVS